MFSSYHSSLSCIISLCILLSSASGAVVNFAADLTWELGAPDGQQRYVIHTNGQFPGPPLVLKQGDSVEVREQRAPASLSSLTCLKFTVISHLPFPTTIHFHGIEQAGTPWSDGVPGVSQKPIENGGTFTYRWTATQYGTYWYHGHAEGQIQDGLYGPIIIEPVSTEPSPFSLIANDSKNLTAMKKAEASAKPVVVSDWTHLTSDEFLAAEEETGYDIFCVDAILINGKGSINCQSQQTLDQLTAPPLKKLLNGSTVTDRGCTPPIKSSMTQGNFPTQPQDLPAGIYDGCQPTTGSTEVIHVNAADGWASINWISGMNIKSPVVAIDNHPMWVYAVDGHYIQPQLADTIFMYNGERYSAMIQLNQPPGDYTIRVANSGADQIISGFATLSYKHGKANVSSTPFIDYGGVNTSASVTPLDKTLLVPFPSSAPAPTADATYILNLGRYDANYNWTLSGNASYGLTQDFNAPLLFNPESPHALNPNLTIRTTNNTWIDVILQVELSPAAPAQPAHPIHKHSNKAYIIGTANGTFNYSDVTEAMKHMPEGTFNLETPAYRDSFTTPSALQGPAWVAFRYQVVNPGAFFIHCHIQTHLDGGMAMTILDGVDAWPYVPAEYGVVKYGGK